MWGTWKIDRRPFNEHGMFHISNGSYIVGQALGQTATSEKEALANARLIAAAPDLLEALKALLACPAIADGGLTDPEWGCQESAEAAAQARAALAKAEGRS